VRTARLELAGWQDVCPGLPHLERLAEEERRRLRPEPRAPRTPLATVASQRSTRRQGSARWSERSAAGRMATHAWAPWLTRLRPRLARVEEPRHARAEEAGLGRGMAVEEWPAGGRCGHTL
jgi:hypothetical protein